MGYSRAVSDIVLAVFVIAIVAMLIIPLPTFLIDILIVINIAFALLLLLVGLYMPSALALLSFPTLLLLTTLFRLGLNVASTRLILSQADAGRVIHAFGTFLVRGEIVVGIIIFTIITVVNFIVIARGASRVSVVAARFTLDSLPGKQAAIDADLRSGLISNDEAISRRDDLRKESQLYGSMDGAMQFVQGDAIAGFFIILTNIFGGMYIGIASGQSVSDALNTYTVLTIGDGLVTQIPALLISICAGIVVTRVSSGEKATLSTDLSNQLFSNPLTLVVAGVMLFFIGLMPGLPLLPFALVAMMFFVTSFLLRKSPVVGGPVRALIDYKGSSSVIPGKSEFLDHEAVRSFTIFLDTKLGYKLFSQKEAHYRAFWDYLRADYHNEVGMRLPELQVLSDDLLSPLEYSLEVSGSNVQRELLIPDTVLLELNPDFSYLYSFEVVKEAFHPLTQQRIFWAAAGTHVDEVVSAAGLRRFDFFEYIALRTAVFYSENPQELVTISEVHAQLKGLEKRYPGLVGDVLARNFLDIPRLCELLHLLVRQDFNIRDFKYIVEQVAVYCSLNSINSPDVDSAVLHDLAVFIRQSKRRQSSAFGLSQRRTVRVCTVSTEVEDIFTGYDPSRWDQQRSKAIEAVRGSLLSLIKPISARGLLPISLLIRPELRSNLESFVNLNRLPVRVLAMDEMNEDIPMERIGVWGI